MSSGKKHCQEVSQKIFPHSLRLELSHIATPCYPEAVKASSCLASSTEGTSKGERYWEGLLGIAPGQPTKGVRDTPSETHDILRQVIMDVLTFIYGFLEMTKKLSLTL